jgi:hypothetical protein
VSTFVVMWVSTYFGLGTALESGLVVEAGYLYVCAATWYYCWRPLSKHRFDTLRFVVGVGGQVIAVSVCFDVSLSVLLSTQPTTFLKFVTHSRHVLACCW